MLKKPSLTYIVLCIREEARYDWSRVTTELAHFREVLVHGDRAYSDLRIERADSEEPEMNTFIIQDKEQATFTHFESKLQSEQVLVSWARWYTLSI